ncbi:MULTISPECIES: DUF1413 domain-containing protein [Pseudomonas]|uniref:DUF1413 domain-containing protein n=1 Tax=Pseudomonas TaxID=286 RepID=UPI002005C041|nr:MULTISPECIES: DUF1413 domain-containing protein [Pseudomonas]MCK6250518.1 single-stranded DNA-binding protein [Pseudomonas fragi]
MKITVEIRDDLLAALLDRSSSSNSTAEDVLNGLLAAALDQPEAESVDLVNAIQVTLKAVEKVPHGETFLVEDVIPNDIWQSMTTGDRKSFGKTFRKQVDQAGLATWVTRNSGNKAIYRRSINSGE